MKLLSRLFNTVPKRLAGAALVAVAIALPVSSLAAATVAIEADTTVANATNAAGTMQWGTTTTAGYNDVVAVQVVYNNTEEPQSNKVATNLRVKINIPTTAGANQTITTKTSADNSNTVNGSAKVTLSRSDAYLQYIPGTATWKHADTANGPMTVTQKVSDDVVMSANGLVLENENPCQAGSIVVQARVMVPGVSVDKYVRHNGDKDWARSITAKPGDVLQYEIAYKNTGNTNQADVEFRDKLPKGVTYVPGSTMLKNSTYSNGTKVTSDAVVTDGITTGTYLPGAAGYVMFNVKVDSADKLACGTNTLRNVAFVQPKDMNYYYNTADVVVNKECQPEQPQPQYSCTAFEVTKGENRTVTVSKFTTSQKDATFKSVVIDWGENGVQPLSTNKAVGQTHQYAADGTYTVTATAHFSTAKDNDVTSTNNCVATVTFSSTTPPETPKVLPSTGAGSVIGLFAVTAAAASAAYYFVVSRRFARQ
jgi:uncharacterized repeat protein (TIGR01451 family)